MPRLRLTYLFTTFPEVSETFLQREVRAMRDRPVDFTLHSLWGGEEQWEDLPVECFGFSALLSLIWRLPYWLWRRPRAMLEVATALTRRPPPSWLNAGENLLGLGFALVHARRFELRAARPHLCHAVWATTPAAAGWMLERLLGIPYTMGAHAFDVFQHGGDWLLEEKLRAARLIHTTTGATRARLIERGANAAHIVLIRRGLDEIPPLPPRRAPGKVLHLLAIGRLIPKKGFPELLRMLRHLRERGIAFECRIVGGGPLEQNLRARAHGLALEDCVRFTGGVAVWRGGETPARMGGRLFFHRHRRAGRRPRRAAECDSRGDGGGRAGHHQPHRRSHGGGESWGNGLGGFTRQFGWLARGDFARGARRGTGGGNAPPRPCLGRGKL